MQVASSFHSLISTLMLHAEYPSKEEEEEEEKKKKTNMCVCSVYARTKCIASVNA